MRNAPAVAETRTRPPDSSDRLVSRQGGRTWSTIAMTDPMTVAIATAMAGKAVEVAGEPVRAAVAELTRRVRERFRGRPADEQVLARAVDDHERIGELQGAVRRLLDEDPDLRDQLGAVWNQAQTAAQASGDGVVNVFSGPADTVIQFRDVYGDVNLT